MACWFRVVLGTSLIVDDAVTIRTCLQDAAVTALPALHAIKQHMLPFLPSTNMPHHQIPYVSPHQRCACAKTDSVHVCCVQVLLSEVHSLKQQVQQLSDLLQTVVPSLPPSPMSSSRMLSSP